jgi:hypothetical protein
LSFCYSEVELLAYTDTFIRRKNDEKRFSAPVFHCACFRQNKNNGEHRCWPLHTDFLLNPQCYEKNQ